MTTLRILIHHGKHGDSLWLADTQARAAQARETLFQQFDEEGCYVDADADDADGEGPLVRRARAGDDEAIETILDSRRGCEYESWDYQYVEVPSIEGIPTKVDLLGFDAYQQAAHSLSIYPDDGTANYAALGLTGEIGETVEKLGRMLEEALLALKLAGAAGQVANQVKKIARDDAGQPTRKRKQALLKELGDCQWYIAETATKMGFNLSDVAHVNMVNLFGRQSRGTISGDGDSR